MALHAFPIGITVTTMARTQMGDDVDVRRLAAGEIRAECARQDVSLLTLAERTGIPKSTLSNKLKGRSDFTVTELILIARALDVSAATLITAVLGVVA